MNKYYPHIGLFTIPLLFIFLSSCVLNPILDATESISGSYEVVKNANSLGKVSDGIDTLANTRKIKAETTDKFVSALDKAIAKQPLENQASLISQSIEAKVVMATSGWWAGFKTGFMITWFFVIVLIIGKYAIDKFLPKESTKKWS